MLICLLAEHSFDIIGGYMSTISFEATIAIFVVLRLKHFEFDDQFLHKKILIVHNELFDVIFLFPFLYRVDQKSFYIWIGSCIMQLRQGGAEGLRNARVANGNLMPWHDSEGDNLHSAYASTISNTKILFSLQHTA